MSKDTHKKIALVTISLGGGGAERSTAILSQVLSNKGFDVHIIMLTNHIDYEYSGTLFNLGVLKTEKDSLVKRLIRFAKFKEYLRLQKFDFIIDNRNRSGKYKEWYYLNYLYCNERVVYVVRSARLSSYFPGKSTVAKRMTHKAAGIVGVSKVIATEINKEFKTDKAVCIYNPIAPVLCKTEKQDAYFIFVGRLVDDVKNVSLLIDAFAKATTTLKTHTLKIYGDGPDKEMLTTKVADLGMQNHIIFKPFTSKIYDQIAKAHALVLSSHYEGFPRVIIEALALGTPVISVDCKSGPNEIIVHRENGLLVENYNTSLLAAAFDTMVEDVTLYRHLQKSATKSVAHLSLDAIGNEWEQYLNNL